MTETLRIGEARPRVARQISPGTHRPGHTSPRAHNPGAQRRYFTVGRSGLDTSYTRPGWVSKAANFSAFSPVRSVVPHTTVRPSIRVSVIDETDGAATRLTCATTSGRRAVITCSAAVVGGSAGPG